MFENPRGGRQARNFTTNVPKILDLKLSFKQIFSENGRWVPLLYHIKARDSRKNLSLMQRHILNKRKPSCTHISPRITLQVLKKGVKGQALKILRKNSSETTFKENNPNFKKKNA